MQLVLLLLTLVGILGKRVELEEGEIQARRAVAIAEKHKGVGMKKTNTPKNKLTYINNK